mgnify:CR=1 FL=1
MKLGFFLILILSCGLYGEDFEPSHIVEPGDVFSADMFNQQHANLKKRLKAPSNLDLVGKWSCQETLFNPVSRTGFSSFESGLYAQNSVYVATFKNDGDGTFSVTNFTTGPVLNGAYFVAGSAIFVEGSSSTEMYTIQKYSDTRVSFRHDSSVIVCNLDEVSSNASAASNSGTWKKIAMAKPTRVSASLSGNNVSLSWEDNNSDETGFKIFRKNARDGSFLLIHTTSANTTSYVDSIPDVSANFWYKIIPTNSSGDGKSSKTVKIKNVSSDSSSGKNLTFVAGDGIKIETSPTGNTITISVLPMPIGTISANGVAEITNGATLPACVNPTSGFFCPSSSSAIGSGGWSTIGNPGINIDLPIGYTNGVSTRATAVGILGVSNSASGGSSSSP